MRSHVTRRLATLAVAGLTTLSLAACGGGSTSAVDKPAGAAAATAMPTAGADGKVDPAAFMDKLVAALQTTKTAHIQSVTKVQGMNMSISGDVDYSTKPVSMKISMSNPASKTGGSFQLIYVGGKMYMGNPSQPGKFMVMDPQMMGQTDLSSMDLVSTFQQYTKAVTAVQDKGSETKDGQSLHHYVMTLDTSKIPNVGDGAAAAQLPKSLSYDLWLDDQSHVSHTTMSLGTLGSVDMVMNHWNEPVSIQAPPASAVTTP